MPKHNALPKNSKPLAVGYKGDGEGGYNWALFRYPLDPAVMRLFAPFYHGPGRLFASPPWVRRRGNVVIVKQFTGLDI